MRKIKKINEKIEKDINGEINKSLLDFINFLPEFNKKYDGILNYRKGIQGYYYGGNDSTIFEEYSMNCYDKNFKKVFFKNIEKFVNIDGVVEINEEKLFEIKFQINENNEYNLNIIFSFKDFSIKRKISFQKNKEFFFKSINDEKKYLVFWNENVSNDKKLELNEKISQIRNSFINSEFITDLKQAVVKFNQESTKNFIRDRRNDIKDWYNKNIYNPLFEAKVSNKKSKKISILLTNLNFSNFGYKFSFFDEYYDDDLIYKYKEKFKNENLDIENLNKLKGLNRKIGLEKKFKPISIEFEIIDNKKTTVLKVKNMIIKYKLKNDKGVDELHTIKTRTDVPVTLKKDKMFNLSIKSASVSMNELKKNILKKLLFN